SISGTDYVGLDVHRAARIAAAGHGGQVLLSESTRSLIEPSLPEGVTTRDLGQRRLKDLSRPERIYQLVIEGLPSEFPPLSTPDAVDPRQLRAGGRCRPARRRAARCCLGSRRPGDQPKRPADLRGAGIPRATARDARSEAPRKPGAPLPVRVRRALYRARDGR